MSATHEADTGRASYELHHLPPHTEAFNDYIPTIVKNAFGAGGGGAAAGSSAPRIQRRRGRSGSRVSVRGRSGSGSRSGSHQMIQSQSSSSHRVSNLPQNVQIAFAELHRHLGADSSDNASVNSSRSSNTAEETAPPKRGKGDGTLRPLKLGSIDSVDTGSAFETIVPQTYRVQQPR
jgi:hypothetical protein